MANPHKTDSQLSDRNNKPLIGLSQPLIVDAVVTHSLTDVDASLGAFTQAELEAVLDELGTKINAILDILEAHGLMKDV